MLTARMTPRHDQCSLRHAGPTMHRHLRTAWATTLLVLVLTLPDVVQAQFAYEFTNNTVIIAGYSGAGSVVVIPSVVNGVPVTSIGGSAFQSCTTLTSIAIPDSVTNLGGSAFYLCTNLLSVTIGDTATTGNSGFISIGELAFNYCTSVTNITISKSVSTIGDYAFDNCTNLISVTIGNSATTGNYATSFGDRAFRECTSLTSIYLQGNAPIADPSLLAGDNYATVYYLPGTTGWGPFFDNRPAVLWNPKVQPGGFALRTNQVGFNITGDSNLVVVIEASTNLVNPTWYPLQTNTLNGNPLYFSDPQWTNYASRFYRVMWP